MQTIKLEGVILDEWDWGWDTEPLLKAGAGLEKACETYVKRVEEEVEALVVERVEVVIKEVISKHLTVGFAADWLYHEEGSDPETDIVIGFGTSDEPPQIIINLEDLVEKYVEHGMRDAVRTLLTRLLKKTETDND